MRLLMFHHVQGREYPIASTLGQGGGGCLSEVFNLHIMSGISAHEFPKYQHIFRVKPRTSRERAIQKENWGEKRDEDEEVVRVETDHQVTLVVY